jgi:hypothetical protein
MQAIVINLPADMLKGISGTKPDLQPFRTTQGSILDYV